MATDPAAMAVNGSYANPIHDAPDQGYEAGRPVAADAPPGQASGNGTSSGNNEETPKDLVGWYFVERYYTTLSKSPEKLFLFYNKSSQFVSGIETEKAPVCVGQKAINDRIKELDLQDCKVRITNVDSQGSQSNIVIQVIGEISNNSAPQRKFTQTFVLAEQANGYFLLNDIFRYLLDEEEEFGPGEAERFENQVEAAVGYQEDPASVPDVGGHPVTAPAEIDAQDTESREVLVADTEAAALEQAQGAPELQVVQVEEDPTTVVSISEDDGALPPAAVAPAAALATMEPAVEPVQLQEQLAAEKPKEIQVAATVAAAQPLAEAAAAPKPKTWANLVRGNAPTPIAPSAPTTAATGSPSVPASAVKPTPTVETGAMAASSTAGPPAASSTTPQDSDQVVTPRSSGSEWQTAGQEHSRKQSKSQGPQTPAENSRAYIKNVNDSIDLASLQTALAKIADIAYIDINRQKNCAFVDFSTPAGYRAAVAANPHEVSGQPLYVEERRVRSAGSFPAGAGPRGNNGMRGGTRAGGQGRGDFGRGGNPDKAARTEYRGRGRGNMVTRGRGGITQGGMSQTA